MPAKPLLSKENERENISNPPILPIPRFLISIALVMLLLITGYEVLKQWLYPNITLWQSHVLTIIFSTLASIIGGYFFIHKIDKLYRSLCIALRRERDFAESLINTAQAIVLVLDPEGHIIRINPYMEQISGYRFEEIEGKDWFSAFLPNSDQAHLHQVFKKTIENAQTEGVINTILTKDQEERDIEWYNKTLQDAEGNVLGVLCIGQDVTKRRQTEALLRKAHDESEQRVQERTIELERRATQLTILNEVGSQIASILNLEHIFNRVTGLVQENFGYHHVGLFTLNSEGSILVMRSRAGEFDPLFPPTHELHMGQGMVGWVGIHGQTLLANNVDEELQYVNLYPDVIPTQSELSVPIRIAGEIVGVLDIQSPEQNAFDNSDVMVIETLADQVAVAIANANLYRAAQHELKEREQAEAALKESEARYHMISDLISDIAYAFKVTPEGTLIPEWTAGAFARISGLALEETRPERSWQDLVHPSDIPIAYEAMRMLLSGKPYENEIRFIDKQGDVNWLYTRNHPVWDDQEERVVRIIGAAEDITQRKQMERQMLYTERLAAMGQVTGTLAHEIKNPLQAIHNNLELVLDFPIEADERKESLHVCRSEVERLIQITESILSLARSGREKYHEVDMSALIRQTLDLLRQPLNKAAVKVVSKLPPDLPPVLGDRDQIRQVLLNLVLNAIEAMPNGGSLKIEAHIESSKLSLDLTNDGPCIPSEYIEHIFEPFFTTKPTGVGLGLFISHHIIQQHGGTLRAENVPEGQGVTFTVTLPLTQSN